MTALLTADEAARLTVGVNVIVRPGDELTVALDYLRGSFVAPQDWVALTGPCPTCKGHGCVWNYDLLPPNRDCRDGRRIVPLYRETEAGKWPQCDYPNGVLVGWGSIEVVPVAYQGHFDTGERPCVMVENANSDKAWLVGSQLGDASERCSRQAGGGLPADRSARQPITLDPLPVPGRDFGIVIDCVELA